MLSWGEKRTEKHVYLKFTYNEIGYRNVYAKEVLSAKCFHGFLYQFTLNTEYALRAVYHVGLHTLKLIFWTPHSDH